jgi:hypothetical protein
MELLCPSCQQRIAIPDQYAGQLMKCPLCQGTFTAPNLPGAVAQPAAPTPSPPTPPPVSAETFSYREPVTPPPPSPYVTPEPARPRIERPPAPPEPPPPPPGDYTRVRTLLINPRVVPWIAPISLTLLFLLSFFPWLSYAAVIPQARIDVAELLASRNLWTASFSAPIEPSLLVFLLLTVILAWLLSIVSFLMGQGIIPLPPAMYLLRIWRVLIVLGFALFGFVFFLIAYLQGTFGTGPYPITPWMKLAFRLHVLALIGLGLEFWLDRRRMRNLPSPKIELHS